MPVTGAWRGADESCPHPSRTGFPRTRRGGMPFAPRAAMRLAPALVAVCAVAGAMVCVGEVGSARVDAPARLTPETTPAPPHLASGTGIPLARGPVLVGRPRPAAPPTVAEAPLPKAAPGIALRVEIVAAETGACIPGATWVLGAKTRSEKVPQEERERESGEVVRLGEVEPGQYYGSDERFYDVVRAPAGWIAWDAVTPTAVRTSRYATSLHAIHPLRREADVTVVVREWDGSLARDPWLADVEVAGRSLTDPTVVEPQGPARFRLRGIPFLRRERLEFRAAVMRAGVDPEDEAEDEDAEGDCVEVVSRSVRWRGPIPDDPRDRLVAVATLPRPDEPPPPSPFRAPYGRVPG